MMTMGDALRILSEKQENYKNANNTNIYNALSDYKRELFINHYFYNVYNIDDDEFNIRVAYIEAGII